MVIVDTIIHYNIIVKYFILFSKLNCDSLVCKLGQ